jgi:hypothetical protein
MDGPKVCFVEGRVSECGGREDPLLDQLSFTKFFWCMSGGIAIEAADFLRLRDITSISSPSIEEQNHFCKLIMQSNWLVLPWGHSLEYPSLALFTSSHEQLLELLHGGSLAVPHKQNFKSIRDPRRLWGCVTSHHASDGFPFRGVRFASIQGDHAISTLWEIFSREGSISAFSRSECSVMRHSIDSRCGFEDVVALSQLTGESTIVASAITPLPTLRKALEIIDEYNSMDAFCISAILELVDWCIILGRGDEATSRVSVFSINDMIDVLLAQMKASSVERGSVELYL